MTSQPPSPIDLTTPEENGLDLTALDLSVPRTVHIVGVGGAGMSAIAEILHALGHTVTGSDLKGGAAFDRVQSLGASTFVGHDAAHLGDPDVVTVSTAIPPSNPEVAAARQRGIPVLRRAEVLAALCRLRRTVAVAGTHGKTTTSSMLALVLVEAGLRPSFLIGGDINEIGTGAAWDAGEHFVVEADESDGTFLELAPVASVVTNVEPDHLDHYGSYDALRSAFERFVVGTDGPSVVGVDGPDGAALARSARDAGARVVTFGAAEDADYRIVGPVSARDGARATIVRRGEVLGELHLPIAGLHNLANATAATAVAMELGAPFSAAAAALGRFAGVARRLQFRGEADGVTFIDDYAHLPSEVAAAVSAVRSGSWGRVVAVFQPHRYSRIDALWADFRDAFVDADVVAVTDVFAAGEKPRPGVSGKLVVNAVLDAHPWRPVAYLPRRADLTAYLAGALRPGDVCLTLGAGDLTSVPEEVQAALVARRR
jgi:UDP-N-acetylmuramate--alanine ligase